MRTTLLAALALAAAPLACPAPAFAQDAEAEVDDGGAAVRNAPPLTPERVRRFITAYGGFMRVMGGMNADKLRRQAQALPARMAAGMIAEQALEKGLSLLPPQAQIVIGLGRGLLGMFGVQTSPVALMQGSMTDGEMGKMQEAAERFEADVARDFGSMDALTAVAQQVMMANGRLLFEEVKPTLTPDQARLTAAELAKSGLPDAELAPLVETVRPFRAELKRLFGEDA